MLPVGGIKETLAVAAVAARAGLRRVLLPARNRKDLEEIGEETRKQLELVWLERVKDDRGSARAGGALAAEGIRLRRVSARERWLRHA